MGPCSPTRAGRVPLASTSSLTAARCCATRWVSTSSTSSVSTHAVSTGRVACAASPTPRSTPRCTSTSHPTHRPSRNFSMTPPSSIQPASMPTATRCSTTPPRTPPATWTPSAQPSATRRSATSASRTAPTSVACTQRCSPAGCGRWCSMQPSIPSATPWRRTTAPSWWASRRHSTTGQHGARTPPTRAPSPPTTWARRGISSTPTSTPSRSRTATADWPTRR